MIELNAMPDSAHEQIVDVTAIVDTHPLVDEDDLHGKVAERLKHSKEFGAVVWDATKEYVQKMNLTEDERASVNQWLSKKKEKMQKTILERLHGLHQIDP